MIKVVSGGKEGEKSPLRFQEGGLLNSRCNISLFLNIKYFVRKFPDQAINGRDEVHGVLL